MRLVRISEHRQYLREYSCLTFAREVERLSGTDLHEFGFLTRTVRKTWDAQQQETLEAFFRKMAKDKKRNAIPVKENKSVFTYISRKVLDSSYSDEEVRCKVLHYFKVLKISKKHLK
jgi:hypothetical protein